MAQAVDFEKVQLTAPIPEARSRRDVFHIGGSEPLRALFFGWQGRDDELVRDDGDVRVRDFSRRPDRGSPSVVGQHVEDPGLLSIHNC